MKDLPPTINFLLGLVYTLFSGGNVEVIAILNLDDSLEHPHISTALSVYSQRTVSVILPALHMEICILSG